MKHKSFKNIIDESELGYYQTLMYELDSSLERMRYISLNELTDSLDIECFNEFWDRVVNNEAVIVSISEDANLYELSDDNVLLITIEKIDNKMFVFDTQDSRKIIKQIGDSINNH